MQAVLEALSCVEVPYIAVDVPSIAVEEPSSIAVEAIGMTLCTLCDWCNNSGVGCLASDCCSMLCRFYMCCLTRCSSCDMGLRNSMA